MKLKNVLKAVSAAAVLVTASFTASAAYVVLDGWQLVLPSGTTTNIGRMNLVSGTATIEQQVNGLGNAFVGAKFKESGSIFSLSFTSENVVGAGDTGAPGSFGETLTLSFSNVMGEVTALNAGGGFRYSFTSGSFLIEGAGGVDYALGSIVGLGGNAASTSIIGGQNGDSTILATIDDILLNTFDIRDSAGDSLEPDLLAGEVLFEAVTNNNITDVIGTGVCSFDDDASCLTFSAASAGDAYLVRDIPEPGSIALLGLGLLGLGAARRRKSAI